MPVKLDKRTYRSELRAATAEETRLRIITAARSVLSGGKNMPAFSLDGVARVAGVTRLTVYNQFGSKQGLLEALFDDTARLGGLFELHTVLAQADPKLALRQFVTVFCKFWDSRARMFPKFDAVAKLDDEIAASVKRRTERRRGALTALVSRLDAQAERANTDLIDILFALTSFEMFDALAVRNRSVEAIEALLQVLVADAVERGCNAASTAGDSPPRKRAKARR